MAFKFIALFALIAAASAAPGEYYEQPALIKSYQPAVVQQVVQPAYVKKVVEHEAPATYDFEYSVHDDHTGDIKEQHESAKDGVISGFYTLIDADGYKRIVHYTADDHHGFNAEVRREPVEGHKVVKTVQPVVVKKIIAQPAIAVQKYVSEAPQYYSAPAEQKYYSAPAPQYYSAPAPVVQKYVAPVVQKYVAQAPQYYSAPAEQKYYSAPAQVVQKYVAPVVKVEKNEANDNSAYTHVSFNGPSSNYHY
jgi:hypothetical protein